MKFVRRISKIIPVVACSLVFTNCAHAKSRDNNVVRINQTYLGELGEGCSIEVTHSDITIGTEPEFLSGFGLAVLAPIISNVISGGIDAIGNALTSAAQEDRNGKQTNTTPASGYFATLNLSPDDLSKAKANADAFCVRALVADISKSPIAARDAGSWTKIEESALTQDVQDAIAAAHGQDLRINKVYFYGEYLIGPVQSPLSGNLYKIEPQIIWYPESIHGNRYKLASMTVALTPSPANADGSSLLQFSHTFAPDGLDGGAFINAENGELGGSEWMPVNLVDSESKKITDKIDSLIKAHKDAQSIKAELEKISTLSQPGGPIEKYSEIALRQRDVNLKTLELDKQTCEAKAKKIKGDSERLNAINLCSKTFENAKFLKDRVVEATLDRDRTIALHEAAQKVSSTLKSVKTYKSGFAKRARLSPFNVRVSLNETRDPNKFYEILGKAITDSKASRDTATSAYVNSQLGLTPDPDEPDLIVETGTYLIAKQKYDIALRNYESAIASGVQATIDENTTILINSYTALLTASKTAGIEITLPPPYE